jgi:hypothetical protein
MAITRKVKKVNLKDLIDIQGGARMIFVTPHTLENWISAGVLTRYKVRSGRTLVSKSELLALVRKAV